MRYSLAERFSGNIPSDYDFSIMPLFRDCTSLEVIEGRLFEIAHKRKRSGTFVLYEDSHLLEYITITNGVINRKIAAPDTRRSFEKDADFSYEGKRRSAKTVVNSRSLNRWILKDGSSEGTAVGDFPEIGLRTIPKDDYFLQRSEARRIFTQGDSLYEERHSEKEDLRRKRELDKKYGIIR